MKKIMLILTSMLVTTSSYANVYMDFSLGPVYKNLKGESNSYKSSFGAAAEATLGVRGDRWDFGIDATYTYSRQKDMTFAYDTTVIQDDFNWHNLSVGPTLKYWVAKPESRWSYAPFIGGFASFASFNNKVDLRDDITGEDEDASHDILGYGAKVGVQFKRKTDEGSWLDSLHYKIYGSYTKHQSLEGDYKVGPNIQEYKGNTPDKLEDFTVGLLVGFSFGENLWNKAQGIWSK